MARWAGLLLVALALMTGCGGPPEEALQGAAEALAAAEGRSACAREKYQAAEALLAEARELVRQEKYEEAERKAKAAQKLAREAKAEADANWEECNRRKAIVEKAQKGSGGGDGGDGGQGTTEPAVLNTVFFGYDSAELDDPVRATLEENARWFRENPEVEVVLEGHTDERGSVEYNLALGERRARVVKEYLMKLGIDGERMGLLSYGEEKPAAFGQSDDDHRRNRRVEFIEKRR